MTIKNILVLCTGNSARSIIGECLIREMGKGQFTTFSAGSKPRGQIHPGALDILAKNKIPTENTRSKSWDEFTGDDAPPIDLVITVCGNAADETCPIWQGSPLTVHWGLDDPDLKGATDTEISKAFDIAFKILKRRVKAFLKVDLDENDQTVLRHNLMKIGEL